MGRNRWTGFIHKYKCRAFRHFCKAMIKKGFFEKIYIKYDYHYKYDDRET